MNNLQAVHVRPVCFDVCKLYFHSTNNKNNNKKMCLAHGMSFLNIP